MILILMRHGEAFSEYEDPMRPLTPEGRAVVQKTAGELQGKIPHLDEIWHSRKKRSAETAALVAETFGAKDKLGIMNGLNPNDSTGFILDEIGIKQAENKRQAILVVGHMPQLANLVEELTRQSITFSFYPATACVFEYDAGRQKWIVKDVLQT